MRGSESLSSESLRTKLALAESVLSVPECPSENRLEDRFVICDCRVGTTAWLATTWESKNETKQQQKGERRKNTIIGVRERKRQNIKWIAL
jgi:hypothetical protein